MSDSLTNETKSVTISTEDYEYLKSRDEWLQCLEAAGVDNWEGYDYAHELKQERSHEQEE